MDSFKGFGGEEFAFPRIVWPAEKRIVVWLYKKLFKRGSLRLDFLNFPSVIIGDGTSPFVAIAPQRLHHLVMVLLWPHLRLGESYMNGEWFVTEGDLADFFYIILSPSHHKYLVFLTKISGLKGVLFWVDELVHTLMYKKRIPKHYNINTDCYEAWLDEKMQYTCAYFSTGLETLDEAQQAKMTLIIERLKIENDMKVLEIGCGWGGLSREIAQNHKVDMTGLTISDEQYKKSQNEKKLLGSNVQDRLNYHLASFQEFLPSKRNVFDRIVSVGMLEQVGLSNLPKYFGCLESSLKKGGLALTHTIIRPKPTHVNSWITRYIFPGAYVPTIADIGRAIEKTDLYIEAIYFLEPRHYFQTLKIWRENFHKTWQATKDRKYDSRFFRMIDFYFAGVQNNFRRDQLNFRIAHFVVSKNT